jgi:glucose-6-phosphate isomerase
MHTNIHTALARVSALAARPDGRRITPPYATDPNHATRFSASLDDLMLEYAKSSIDDTARDALFAATDLDGFRRRTFGSEVVPARW